jgi:beta-N-acetylhexosaminidase
MLTQNLLRDFGQLFIMAFDGPTLHAEVLEFLQTFRIGGVILFRDNFRSVEQLRRLTAQVRDALTFDGLPPWIATDHEGGRVQRFHTGFTRIPPMAEVGAGEATQTYMLHRQIGEELKSVGINLDFTPVADLCAADSPGAIGDRSFGTDPALVAEHVSAAVRGLQDVGILACVKHFPGHGATVVDSHDSLPTITLTRTELDRRDLIPFQAALQAGVGSVMAAHVLYPAAGDAERPASLSRYWLHTVLREQLHFDGLVVTDAIEMRALLEHWTPEECGAMALQADVDILLYYKEAHQFRVFDALRTALACGELDPAPIARSLERMRRAKTAWLH